MAWANTEVGQVKATDADAAPNNRLMYSIQAGGDGRFYIDRTTGEKHRYVYYNHIIRLPYIG